MAELKTKRPKELAQAKPLSGSMAELVKLIGTLTGAGDPTNIMPMVGMTGEMPDAGRRYLENVLADLFRAKGTKAYGPMSAIHATIGQKLIPKMTDDELLQRLDMFGEPHRMKDFFTP